MTAEQAPVERAIEVHTALHYELAYAHVKDSPEGFARRYIQALADAGVLVTPEHDRHEKAEALREVALRVDEKFTHCEAGEEHPEGTCPECDLLFAVCADLNERADDIERGEADG